MTHQPDHGHDSDTEEFATQFRRNGPFFRDLVEHSLDGFLTFDPGGTIVFSNHAAERLFGWTEDELVGEPVTRLFPKRFRDSYLESLHRHARDGSGALDHEYVERIGLRKDGSEFPLAFSFYEHEHDGRRLFTAIIRDISERKQRERELENTKEKYERLVEAAPDAIFIADTETGTIEDANRAAATLMGKSQDELCGMHLADLHPTKQPEQYATRLHEYSENGGDNGDATGTSGHERTRHIVRDDGTHIPVEVSTGVTDLADKTVVQGIFRDVSGRQERKEELRRERDLTERILETSPIAIGVFTPDRRLVRANEQVAAILGEPIEQLLSRPSLDDFTLYDSENRPIDPRDAIMAEVIETGSAAYDYEAILERADGERLWVSLSAAPLRSPDGELEYLVLVGEDISERKEREAALERHRDRLDTLNRINRLIREINQTLVRTTTREEIETSVCERLAASDLYQDAFIGERSLPNGGIEPRTGANLDANYFDLLAETDTVETSTGGAAEAISTQEPQLITSIQSDPLFPDSLRDEALSRGYRSVLCIPLVYRETTYGVLVLHSSRSDAFSERERAVFQELGKTIGHAIHAAESKKLLHTDSRYELTFDLTETTAFFVTASADLQCSITLEDLVPSTDRELLYYITLENAPADAFLEMTRRQSIVKKARCIREEPEQSLLEIVFVGASTSPQVLIERGARIKHAKVIEGSGSIVAEAPADADIRVLTDAVQSIYPNARLTTKREVKRSLSSFGRRQMHLTDQLTDRQQAALTAAYNAGFFEWPRESTGEAVADSLAVSAPTFHQHLRASERKLLQVLFEGTETME
ncbi:MULTISPECIES: PAS domain S-box protein [unclassified Haladaptatus]|uniref:PAS domain S-box protein n=1 Tax=unclassified Haladaptatus TaxID=2622732 RepID=UPI00209C3359|nr:MULTISPECIES: PAS domain S-box protein [unclassified Haladaptatus]MCO8243523.1 PAS domain S-box protein [Haladaptatus sp. AB643]MCO8254932.1 PAS domain S-box protein [Haladaptatus sp. AB618]